MSRSRAWLPTALLALGILLAAGTALAQTIELTDQRGVTVTLDGPAERVITFPMPAASLFIAVAGSPDALIGMHAASKAALRAGILGELFPGAEDIPADIALSGFAPNVEAVLSLEPDLVFQWATNEDLIAPLENAGVRVVGLNYGTQQDLETWIELMAVAIGRPERAERILGWHREALAELRGNVAAADLGEAPRILYFNRLADQLRVAGRNTYNDFYIGLVGGVNVAAELSGFTDVSAEQVLVWDPDIILVGNFDAATPADVYARPLWSELSAVASRRVYKVPLGGYRWDPPNQESPLMWTWLAQLAHPDAFAFDLRGDARDAYRLLYGAELTGAQLDAILQADLNRDAAGYDRFLEPGTP